MNAKSWTALGLILPALLLERMAFYGARSRLAHDLMQWGHSGLSANEIISQAMMLGYFASLLAGVIALAIGARPTAALGTVLATAGLTVLALDKGGPAGVFLFALGAGIFRPCPVAAAAEIVANDGATSAASPRRFAMIAAFSTVVYGTINLGALLGPILNSLRPDPHRGGPVFVLAAVMEVAACALLVATAVLGTRPKPRTPQRPPNDPYRTHAATELGEARPTTRSNAIGGVARLALLMFLYSMTSSLGASRLRSVKMAPALTSLNPLVVIVISLLLAAFWSVAARRGGAVPPLRAWGVGFAIFGAGLVPLALGVREDGVASLYALGAVITAVGETAIVPMSTTYAALSIRPRVATLVIGALSLLGWVGFMCGTAVDYVYGLRTPFVLTSAVVCMAIGAIAAAFAPRLHQLFFAADQR